MMRFGRKWRAIRRFGAPSGLVTHSGRWNFALFGFRFVWKGGEKQNFSSLVV
jgi:hypothetical protein